MDEKNLFSLTDFGREQVALGYEVSQEVGKNFYQGFEPQEIELIRKTIRTYFGKYRKG